MGLFFGVSRHCLFDRADFAGTAVWKKIKKKEREKGVELSWYSFCLQALRGSKDYSMTFHSEDRQIAFSVWFKVKPVQSEAAL